jgi:hypothetical protein
MSCVRHCDDYVHKQNDQKTRSTFPPYSSQKSTIWIPDISGYVTSHFVCCPTQPHFYHYLQSSEFFKMCLTIIIVKSCKKATLLSIVQSKIKSFKLYKVCYLKLLVRTVQHAFLTSSLSLFSHCLI